MSEPRENGIAVIGGGISGLAIAWFLYRQGRAVRLFEADTRVGGMIRSRRQDGFLVEHGPNTTLQKAGRPEDAIGRLIADLGLEGQLREADPAGRKRFVLKDGRLQPLPASPPAFLRTPLFSFHAKVRLLAEPFIARARREETIAAFVRRRLGREFLDYAVDPFVSGVYAGDPETLSARAAVPRIHEIEQVYGSLIRGAVALGRAAKDAGMPAGRQISFPDGLETLPHAIAASLPAGTLELGRRATALARTGNGWRISFSDGTEQTAESVVVALPAAETARLLRPLSAPAADLLEEIPYAGIVSVAMGYRRDRIAHALDGFGFLVPRREDMRTLGALFSSTLFKNRAPADHVLLTAFVGGTRDTGALALDDETLFGIVQADLARALGISGRPAFRSLVRWPHAIAQYGLGHLERLAAIERALEAFPGLHLQATWRGGIAVADAVRNAESLADNLSPVAPRNKP